MKMIGNIIILRILFIFTMLFLPFNIKLQTHKEEKAITKIIIGSENFLINYFYHQSCDRSFEYFHNVNIDTITTESEIKEFKAILDSLKPYQFEKFKYGIDTRARILVFYDNKQIDTICVGFGGYIEINQMAYRINRNFFNFIRKYNPEALSLEDMEILFKE